MEIEQLIREFKYNGVALADPGAMLSLEQVRDFYASVYPEILSADIEGPQQVAGKQIYTFRRAVGTKGASRAVELALQQLRSDGRLDGAVRPVNVLTAAQARQPLAQQVKRILEQASRAGGVRCLAPSANHLVLP